MTGRLPNKQKISPCEPNFCPRRRTHDDDYTISIGQCIVLRRLVESPLLMPSCVQLRTGEQRTLYPVACWLVRRHGSLAQWRSAKSDPMAVGIRKGDTRVRVPQELLNPDGGMTHEHKTNHTNVHRSRKHTVPPPEGKVCTATKVQRRKYPAPDESKRVLHKGRAELVTSPAIKDVKVYSCDRLVEGYQITR